MARTAVRVEHSDGLGLEHLYLNENGEAVCPNSQPHPAHANTHKGDVLMCEGRSIHPHDCGCTDCILGISLPGGKP